MKEKRLYKGFALLAAMALGVSLLSGCAGKSTKSLQEQEDAETIQVYLWTAKLYEKYAPYVQAQLPDVNIEFIVGNNDLDFYKFLQQNGGLPDIITCCRFSLHDAAPLKNSLMNLATTNEAGAIYNIYLNSFKNEDGSVNWLPVCPDAHGFVVNRDLFEQYDIPLPNDYAGFVAACKAFEEVGIRGYTADYLYDYTCMETLQGLSAAELMTTQMAHRLQRPRQQQPCRAGQHRVAGCLRAYGAVHSGHRSYGGGSGAELRCRGRDVRQRAACHVLWQLCRRKDVPRAGHRRNLFAVLQPKR